ncbi:MAG TPA: aldose 1-epimerase [Allosphingosinicella sp.]
MTPITLTAGRLELVLAPAVGGSIARFDWLEKERRINILRPAEGAPASVLDAASFPLVPFSNRIRDGRFSFRHRNVTLAANMTGDPSPLHGQGWVAPWKMLRSNSRGAELEYVHEPGEWPWRYEARQRFDLDENGLTLGLTCRNLSDEPMPCGLGQHPYFPCSAQTRLDTEVSHVWTIDENVLPVGKVKAEGRYDLRDRSVCGQGLDHGFGGWGGAARISDPGLPFEIMMSSPQARYFQLYSPEAGGIFVAEPVSHANAALSAPEEEWGELGMRVLEPGEEMELEMRLEIVAQ